MVHAAGRLIRNNTVRFNKQITTINPSHSKVKILKFKTVQEENQYVVDTIIKTMNENLVKPSEIAIIYRTNSQPRQLVEKLMEYNVSFTIRDKLPNIYEHWIARDLIAYLKLALGELKRSHFLRVMNKPTRYISRDDLTYDVINFDTLKSNYVRYSKQWMIERMEQLEYDLKILAKLGPKAAIGYIRKAIGYESYLVSYAHERKIKFSELQDILNEIQESTASFVTISEWFAYIQDYGEKLEEKAVQAHHNKESLTLTTMHSAKGLEYDMVFIIDANEGIIPHEKSTLLEDLEEERRLFYVAMTRARKYLEIITSEERYNKKYKTSRFINEIISHSDPLRPEK